jgi:hypothetical protein
MLFTRELEKYAGFGAAPRSAMSGFPSCPAIFVSYYHLVWRGCQKSLYGYRCKYFFLDNICNYHYI